jgi:GR25 family glycosyltransferase involved in LPS biosynthesis
MDSYYINLDKAIERRLSVEESFSKYSGLNYLLNRVPAVDANFVLSKAFEGKIAPTEKACLLSHKKAIERSLEKNSNALILEDDVQFGPNSFNFLKILNTLPDDSTDIVFTDIDVCNPYTMMDLFVLRKKLMDEGTFQLIDLKDFLFFGTTGYLVLNRAKRKIIDLIESLRSYDAPYDIQLKQWINDGKLNAKFVFPFATTVSKLADSSGIQFGNSGGCW